MSQLRINRQNIEIFFFLFPSVCVYLRFIMCVCLYEYMSHVYGFLWKPEKALDSLELKLQAVVSSYVGAEN